MNLKVKLNSEYARMDRNMLIPFTTALYQAVRLSNTGIVVDPSPAGGLALAWEDSRGESHDLVLRFYAWDKTSAFMAFDPASYKDFEKLGADDMQKLENAVDTIVNFVRMTQNNIRVVPA